jgi:glyoxylase-like metal-dependent hydrolase (beta-lactamase superfamily II)
MQIDYPFDTLPAAGTSCEVAAGVHWLRMPLPFALDHINLWLLEDGEAWTAVDTGIAIDAVKDAWKSVLAGRQLDRQIVTHFHPDHLGLAAWLEAETGAPLWMTQGEYMTAHLVAEGIAPFDTAAMLAFLKRHGLDTQGHDGLAQRGNAYRRGVPAIPESFHRLMDGDAVRIGDRDWRVIIGYGHAPEHASLYCAELGVLISGDMLLPRISTNVSAYAAGPRVDALGLYLDSIARLTELPADTLVLPSHGKPFRGLHARVAALQQHHADRCADLLAACTDAPRCAGELLATLFGRPFDDPHQIMFAMGEAIAHLIYLEKRQRLARTEENGIIRYATTQ